jgi:hypothetical protein
VSLATTFYVTSPCNCAGRGDCYSGGSVCASMGLSDRVQHGGADLAATQPGHGGADLAATQPGHTALPDLRHTGLFWGDLGSPRGEELSDFGTVVHLNDTTAVLGDLGCPFSAPINRDFPVVCAADLLEDMTTTFRSVRGQAAAVLATASLVAVLAGCSTDSPGSRQ